MNILFTAVGGTDPITGGRDGAILHICRFFNVDKVVMYLSKEMCEKEDASRLYTKSLEKLGELQNKKYEMELIRREELVEVQEFDYFIQEYKLILDDIKKEKNVEKIYVNVSSGTPAMKSALLFLSAIVEDEYIPIQVSTPEKKENSRKESKEDFDTDTWFELDEDNEEGAENRTRIASSIHWVQEIKKDTIKNFIYKYDYEAAYEIGKTIYQNGEILTKLRNAMKRYKLDNNYQMKNNISFINDKRITGKKAQLIEAALVAKVKLERDELLDFSRAMTPITFNLYLEMIKQIKKIDIMKEFIKKDTWDMKKLMNSELYSILDKSFSNGFKGGRVSNHHLAVIVQEIVKTDKNDFATMGKIIDFEQKIRNCAAHEIISISKEDFVTKVGCLPTELWSYVESLFNKFVIKDEKMEKKIWYSYSNMNDEILKVL